MSQSSSNGSNIPLSEVYWTLVNKADKKFSKIRDLPFYERKRYETYFYKVFKVYTQLWKFQQENRQKLVDAGLKRWEIGEIASRIAQLYYGQYMRTSDAGYLSESYIFYEAIHTREYFKEGLFQDLNLANKQLRFFARFLMVCLVLSRREMVQQLVDQLKLFIDECKRNFQVNDWSDINSLCKLAYGETRKETDFKEWKLVVQEIVRFLKVDSTFMNIRPLRYSLALDPHPDSLPQAEKSITNRTLRLKDAILSSYHYNEVKFSELTLDAFRILQCLEWESSGSFYQSTSPKIGQGGASGSSRINYSQNIVDPTLPPNPRKAVLYRPSVTHFLAVLATVCEELPSDGVLLLYLSASGKVIQPTSSPLDLGSSSNVEENFIREFESQSIYPDRILSSSVRPSSDRSNPTLTQSGGDSVSHAGGLCFGTRGDGGLGCIYPSDLITFTRKPLFIVIDSDSSEAFKVISGNENGEPAALLLSPSCTPHVAVSESSRHSFGSLFTIFLSAPVQAFCLLIGISGSDIDIDAYNNADKLLSSSFSEWGSTLATSDTLHPVWAQILTDPFLRRLLLRFLFCRAVLSLYAPTFNKKEFLPECLPLLPASLLPAAPSLQNVVFQMASLFDSTGKFSFPTGDIHP